jgi:hypothetical protein
MNLLATTDLRWFMELWLVLHIALAAIPPLFLFLQRRRWRLSLLHCFGLMGACCILLALAPRSWEYFAKYPEFAVWHVFHVVTDSACSGMLVLLFSAGACWVGVQVVRDLNANWSRRGE